MGNRICLSTKGIVLVGLILFCLNPVAITFLVFLYFITSRITHRSFLYLSSFVFAAYISCINATKVPDNDLEMNLNAILQVRSIIKILRCLIMRTLVIFYIKCFDCFFSKHSI